jgi:twitching motility two-component system response regulator PilH
MLIFILSQTGGLNNAHGEDGRSGQMDGPGVKNGVGRSKSSQKSAKPMVDQVHKSIKGCVMSKKILVVDDSETDNKALCDMLAANGFETFSAASGEEGVKLAASLRPDAVLMDVVMPGMNGFQACKMIVKDELTSKIPVVMVSNKHQESDVLWAQKQGAKAYFAKPVDEKGLVAKLRELMAGF